MRIDCQTDACDFCLGLFSLGDRVGRHFDYKGDMKTTCEGCLHKALVAYAASREPMPTIADYEARQEALRILASGNRRST